MTEQLEQQAITDLKVKWDAHADKPIAIEKTYLGANSGAYPGDLTLTPLASRTHTAIPNTVQYPFILKYNGDEVGIGYLYRDEGRTNFHIDVRLSNPNVAGEKGAERNNLANTLNDKASVQYVVRLAIGYLMREE